MQKNAAQNGIVFVGKTMTGKESSEIIDFAAKNKFDIIVIGARGLGSVKAGMPRFAFHSRIRLCLIFQYQ